MKNVASFKLQNKDENLPDDGYKSEEELLREVVPQNHDETVADDENNLQTFLLEKTVARKP